MARTVATPTAKTPEGTPAWIARRTHHPDAARLSELVDDPSRFGANDEPSVGEPALLRLAGGAAPWTDAERLWDRFLSGGVRTPSFRLVRDGATLPTSTYCRRAPIGNQQIGDLAEPNRVLELFDCGATLVLQALQFGDPAYARLSTNLALDADVPVQVNAYLSPRNARGLDVHFDFHDVIVVQLAGTKRWRVWRPLPRSERPLKRGPAVAQPSLGELGVPLFDRRLEPGDCIALPRGFPHAAETIDAESTHLTIGLMALTWNRVLRDRIDAVASGTALADRLPIAMLRPERRWDRLPAAALAQLADSLAEAELRHAVALAVWRRQPATRLRPRALPSADALTATTALRLTPGPLLWLSPPRADRRDCGRRSLQLGDRALRFPAEGEAFVADVLQGSEPFTATDSHADVDIDSRLVLLRRLLVEGIVARA